MKNITAIVIGMTFLGVSHATTIKLEEYLGQVQKGHGGIQSSKENSSGYLIHQDEGSLLLAPTFSAYGQKSNDKQLTASPTTQGTKTITESYSFGISKLTTVGLNSKLSYTVNGYDIYGTSPALVATPKFWINKTQLELTQSLWRNFFGRETRATQNVLKAQYRSLQYAENYREKLLLADAESTYWRLSLARESIKIQEDSLARAKKILQWNQSRVNSLLTDKVDLLQSQSAVEARELELQAARDEERSARVAFNTARGIDSEEVDDELEHPQTELWAHVKLQSETPVRDDVKAANEARVMAEANSTLGKEKNSPTFEVYGTLAYNGRDKTYSKSQDYAFKDDYSTTTVGVRLAVPLDVITLSKMHDAYLYERQGAELTYARKKFEGERDWLEVVRKFSEAQRRAALTDKIEKAQHDKLMYERARHTKGRTTTFQVLNFEQDYANAQLAAIRAKGDVLKLIAQMKTFGGV